ncbi:hypothetical protein MSG28_000832 [Choristoneura fumiferana]|uniref:Uncharacterized protein n=1 Tax=Choristoneura fumiferana TaxID=7141 RepID=A0ACC0K2Y9_CHOFU|nr:hypothetical protein MSG28_000832 [Choristoneura fumiferana]
MLRSTKHSSLLVDNEEIIFVNEWAVSRPVAAGEVLTLQLLTRGRWGAPRVLGVYRLGLQILVTDGQLSITDTLVDERNKPVPVFVEMDVFYTAPATLIAPPVNDAVSRTSEAGSARSALVSAPGSRGSLAGSRSSAASDADDDNALEDIQRNIAILERSLQNKEAVVDIESGDESRARRIKSVGKRILRRGFSMGSEKVVTISERERKRPTTMKSMRSLIRLGRARPRSASTDEERGLLEPGPSTEPERPSSQTSMSSEELLVDTRSPTDTPKLKKIRSALDTGGPSALKAADFQVCVTVIEARQLAGLNMDPVVCVQVGDGRKYTSVKESTNCPYYNEYFVFDFHMPPIMLFDKIITLSVLQSRHILRANKLLGSFKLDVATVWNQPDRQFYHKWALLTDPDDIAAGAKGYLKCDISVIGKGDTVKIPPKSEKDEDDIEANLLLPDGVPIERQRAKFVVKIYKADGLPKMNYSILANVKRAFTGETQDLVDPYVQVCFAGMTDFYQHLDLLISISTAQRATTVCWTSTPALTWAWAKAYLTEQDNMECPASDVEVEIVPPITESTFGKNEEFFLFASIFDANMIDKRLTDKPIQFELSIGNSGNSLDGHSDSVRRPQDLESDELDEMSADTGYWQSTTAATKASSLSDKSYYYLPYWDHKQCMHVRSIWPDHRRRMYNSNLIANVIEKFNEGGRDSGSVAALRAALEAASAACAQYARHVAQAPPIGNTKLDRERQKMCLFEIEQMSTMTKSLRALITKHSIKDRLRTAYTYLNKLKRLCEDPQQAMPDVFIWMISNGKRLAYQRITARDIIYSDHEKEGGKHCGKMQTFFLKWPGKKASSPSGWNIPAKISVYLWLGVLQDKKHYIDGLPQGYELSLEIRNADKLRSNAPAVIFYAEKHNAKRNPNFTNPVKFVDVELPDQDLYRPPLTIRVVDCRSFGRITLVGTHTINSIHKYIYTPMSKREKEIEERKKSLIQLQNVDLKANCIVHDDMFSVENEKENCPLLTREGRSTVSYGSGVRQSTRKRDPKGESFKKRKASTDSVLDDDERSKDWWTKYFASVECMIEEEKEAKKERQGYLQTPQVVFVDETRSPREEVHSPRPERDRFKRRRPLSPRAKLSPTILKKNEIPTSALSKIYPHELEAVSEFDEFKEWLHSFELYRGKKTGDDAEDESRVVGVPSNDPIHVLVRVYIVKATDLHPMDLNGKADPYIVLHLGSKRISDKENYVSKQLNPVFGKCFEIEATFPQDSMLTIQVLDWDLLGSDDMIGETKIDLENRFYSRHRATCGLPMKYEEQGYNRWRDAMKPTQILAKLCKDGKLDPPVYEYGRVKIGRSVFNMPMHDSELFSDVNLAEEQMALLVLRRWHELPRVGARLVPEHVETRPLYNPNKPGTDDQ